MGSCWDWLTKRRQILEANYVDSKLLPIGILLALRVIFFLYCLGIFIWRDLVSWDHGKYYTYFSNISYLILTLYFGAISLKMISFLIRSHKKRKLIDDHPYLLSPRTNDLLKPAKGVKNYLLLILFTIALQNALFLDLVAWIVLPQYHDWIGAVTFSGVQVHGINTIQMILEVFLGIMPITPLFVIYPLVFTLLYMFFTWIFHAITAIWVYPFEAWGAQYDWLIYFGVVALFFLSWFIWCLLGWIRDRLPYYKDVEYAIGAPSTGIASPHITPTMTQVQPPQRGSIEISEVTTQL